MADSTFMRVASDLVQRAKLASSLLTFEGRRNIAQALGYKDTLTPADYRKRYKRNAIAGRIVEAMPKATWRGAGELIEDENPNKYTEFEQAWANFDKKLQVWSTFLRADVLAGLGNYAVILIGAPGNVDTPLPKRLLSEQIAFLRPYAQDDASIGVADWEIDPTSARFGLPKFYQIGRMNPQNTNLKRRVHYTRVIHVADGLLDDQVNGEPRLERCWNLLDDLEKVTGGGAEAFWLRANQGMQFDLDPEMPVSEDGKKEMETQIDDYVLGMRRFMRTRGMTIKPLGSDVANFDPNASAILEQISGGTGIPKRILTGSELGQLASTQDRLNWAERIADRRFQFAGPQVVRPFVDLMISLGVLPTPSKYDIRWPEIRDLDASERAKVATMWADLNQKTKTIVVTPNEIRDHCLGLLPLAKPDVEKVQDDQGLVSEVDELEAKAQLEKDKAEAAEVEDDLVDDDDFVAAARILHRQRLAS